MMNECLPMYWLGLTAVSWDINSTSASIPQPRGVRMFTFEELKKITCNFSEANDIGKGGYGKVQ